MWLLNQPQGVALREPWRSAWRLVEESWRSTPARHEGELNEYSVQDRLAAGERSGSLVAAIVDLAAPQLTLRPYEAWELHGYGIPARPRTPRDVLRAELSCRETIDPGVFLLGKVTESDFLFSLSNALDSAVNQALDVGVRIGWRNMHLLLRRVYYVPEAQRRDGTHEPDEFGPALAPAVKLLHAVVERLAGTDPLAARRFTTRWRSAGTSVHLRLWASIARDGRIASADEVSEVLRGLNYRLFWDVHHHPEIAELRAVRFTELGGRVQSRIAGRIRKGPPPSFWGLRGKDKQADEERRLYWSLRELKRIDIGSSGLPLKERSWLQENLGRFPELEEMSRLDEGFLDLPEGEMVPPNPERSLDLEQGVSRLRALEEAFSSPPRGGWDASPAERAQDWLSEEGNAAKVLRDLVGSDGGPDFKRVWARLGWTHTPPEGEEQGNDGGPLCGQASQMVDLLGRVPEQVLAEALEGIANWLGSWKHYVVEVPTWPRVWSRCWQLAVESANAMGGPDERTDLEELALNTGVGKLTGLFKIGCPNLAVESQPFEPGSALGQMREEVVQARGLAGMIAKYRLIWDLEYFLGADVEWTKAHLVSALRADDEGGLTLWRAVGYRLRSRQVLGTMGGDMVKRATDARLGRESRSSLARNVVVETLNAFRDGRTPAIPGERVQQMIRSLEGEVRASCARVLVDYIEEVSGSGQDAPSREHLFRCVARPFLVKVWPQERTLASPDLSCELSRLPAAVRGEFVEATRIVERFLGAFECWSLLDYGLSGDDDEGVAKLRMIDSQAKGEALLRLLDRTVGIAEEAVVPHNLGDALDQVREVAPSLTGSQQYRRLRTASRRV